MKNKKRKVKKKRIFGLLFIIILIFVIIFLIFNLKGNKSLKSKGYSNLEIAEIEKLTSNEITTILKYDYNKNLIYMIDSENYNSSKLNLYMKYTLKYNDIDYLKIFELINNENFREDKIDDYIYYLNKYDEINGIIKFVNEFKDKNIKDNDITILLLNEKYFIEDYLNRYLSYYNTHKNLEASEIIKRVNSKLDYKFYDDSSKADTSKGMYTLVNKFYYLSNDFVPDNLVNVTGIYARDNAQLNSTAYENFIKMADDARKEGLTLKITTGYRSYNFQATLYNNYVKIDGVKEADTYSARPGYSEHQLGYSADLTNDKNVSFSEFEYTDEYNWLKNNCYKYGFIMRYPKDKEYLTGYIFEAWHYRYVGVDIATYIYENNITYEEYYEFFLR